jgi:hypothetical protein
LFYVLFLGLSWNLVQNTWIRPENTSRAIWSFPEFEADPEKMKNCPRQIDRSIISSVKKSIDRIISRRKSIDRLFMQPRSRSIEPGYFLRKSSDVDMLCVDEINPIWAVPRGCRHYFVRPKIDLWCPFCKLNLYIYEIRV